MTEPLTDEQKRIVKAYIDANPIKAVTSFDIDNKTISYSDEIRSGRNINVITGDEEIVRAFILTKLVNELGYSLNKIEIEKNYTVGRPKRNLPRIDIIVHDDDGNDFLFIEMKSPHDYSTLNSENFIEDQLFKVAGLAEQEVAETKVRYLVYYTIDIDGGNIKDNCVVIDKHSYTTYSAWKDGGYNSTDEIPINYGISTKRPYVKGGEKDLTNEFSEDMLNTMQTDLHNVLWGGGSIDDNEIFASLTNLILAKIEDEYSTQNGVKYKFQCYVYNNGETETFESNEELFDRINKLYRTALFNRLNITDTQSVERSFVIDRNQFSLNKLRYTVQKLEKYSFVDGRNSVSGRDILGSFFESIVRVGFKQDKGQFFTPINIVKFMLWGLQTDKLAINRINNDQEIPYFIDCSAGSGTFLIEYMKFITENVNHRFRDRIIRTRANDDKMNDWFPDNNRENRWAGTYVYGTEINFNLGTAIKVNMILHGDGSSNVFVGEQKGDGLIPFEQYRKNGGVNELDKHNASDIYYGKEVNEHFDLILTNPPFSVDLDNETQQSLADHYLFGDRSNSSENLFIERYYQLLKPNGRLGVVLPESVFDTSDNKYIRLFLFKYFKIKAVVSLPQLTFQPYTQTKTSILFAQKKTTAEVVAFQTTWQQYAGLWRDLVFKAKIIIRVLTNEANQRDRLYLRGMNEKDYINTFTSLLDDASNNYDGLSATDLLTRYGEKINEATKPSTGLGEYFDNVNVDWVFKKVSSSNILDYEINMCDVEQVGYKRSVRGTNEAPNELFRVGDEGQILVDDGVETTALDFLRKIEWDQ